jgi:nucleotide-binding universal stress UspA family protein
MYKQILCPVDGSQTSSCGIKEAIHLAKDQNAKLRFLHVVDLYFPILDATGDLNIIYIDEVLRRNGKHVLKKAEEAAHKAGVMSDSKEIEAINNRVSEFIVAEAEEWKADLIVMGTHGLRGVERLVMGSDAETVARTSPVPVLLVRSKPDKAHKN